MEEKESAKDRQTVGESARDEKDWMVELLAEREDKNIKGVGGLWRISRREKYGKKDGGNSQTKAKKTLGVMQGGTGSKYGRKDMREESLSNPGLVHSREKIRQVRTSSNAQFTQACRSDVSEGRGVLRTSVGPI